MSRESGVHHDRASKSESCGVGYRFQAWDARFSESWTLESRRLRLRVRLEFAIPGGRAVRGVRRAGAGLDGGREREGGGEREKAREGERRMGGFPCMADLLAH